MKFFIGYFRKCDLVTMLGTIMGITGLMCALTQHFTLSVLCLALCGICDAFDGTLARMGKYSDEEKEYGVQLDSLSDVICFGVLPAIITFSLKPSLLVAIISILYVLCGVIRLAYFNMLHVTNNAKKGIYIGLPITTIAIIYPIVFVVTRFINFSYLSLVLPIILVLMGVLFISRIEIKKVDFLKIFKKIFNKYVINYLLFPIFIVASGDFFYKLSNGILPGIKMTITSIVNYPLAFIFVYFLVLLMYLFLNTIFKTSKKAKIILLVISSVLFIVNDIKFRIMGVPLEFSDVGYLNPDNIKMVGTATTTIGSWVIWTIIKAIIYIGVSILFIIDKRLITFDKIKYRIICCVLSCLAFIGLVCLLIYNKNFVIEKIYRTNNASLNTYYLVSELSDDFGLIQGIIVSGINKINVVPDGYNKEDVISLIGNYKEKESSINWGKANVVFILSESFSDLENVSEITFDKPLMKNIDLYESSSDKMVFDLVVPTKGGVSVNTEFEILTGASLTFLPTGYIPYNQYYNKYTARIAPNIIKEFNNNGYETMYLTPWGKDSYNSKRNYEYFGAKKTIYGTDLSGSVKGMFYSDESLMKDIYNELKTTSDGNYKFIMAATGENHFPYNSGKFKKYDIKIKNSKFSSESSEILLNYAQGVYDADKELNNLYEMIQDLDVPTIIVFYGDHLPYTVDSKGIDPYMESMYFNTGDENINVLRKYTTKAVILSNYDIECEDIKIMNASYLGAYVLNNLDLNISNYFKYIDDTRKNLAAFNKYGILVNNELIPYLSLDSELARFVNDYRYVQYGSLYEGIN